MRAGAHGSTTTRDMRPYYPDRYYGKRHGTFSRHCVKRRLGFVTAAVPDGSGRRLLDIGCGDGSFLLAAREVGWDVLGTEFNPGPARDTGLDVRESIDQFPAYASFDCVTMWRTLEHVVDIFSMLLNIARLLKPGGKLIVAVPDLVASKPGYSGRNGSMTMFPGTCITSMPKHYCIASVQPDFRCTKMASGVRVRFAGVVPEYPELHHALPERVF